MGQPKQLGAGEASSPVSWAQDYLYSDNNDPSIEKFGKGGYGAAAGRGPRRAARMGPARRWRARVAEAQRRPNRMQ